MKRTKIQRCLKLISDQCHLVKDMDIQAAIIVLGDQGCQGQWEYKEKRHLGGEAKVALEWSPRKQARVCSVRRETNTQKNMDAGEAPQQWRRWKSQWIWGHRWEATLEWGLSLDMEDCVLLSYGLKNTSGKTGEGNEQCGGLIRSKGEMKKEKQQWTYLWKQLLSSWAESSWLKYLHT